MGRRSGGGGIRRFVAKVIVPPGGDGCVGGEIAGVGQVRALQVQGLDELGLDELGEGGSGDVFDGIWQQLEGHVGVVGGIEGGAERKHRQHALQRLCCRLAGDVTGFIMATIPALVHGLKSPAPHFTVSEPNRPRNPGASDGFLPTLKSPSASTNASSQSFIQTHRQSFLATRLTISPNPTHKTRQTPQRDLLPVSIIRRISPLQTRKLRHILRDRLIPVLLAQFGEDGIHRDELRDAVHAEHGVGPHGRGAGPV